MNKIYEVIVEFANSHEGKKSSLFKMIEEVENFDYPNFSVKFQIFSPDGIAIPDFEWYETYKKITFTHKDWEIIINLTANKNIGIWIDIFDYFGVEIFEKHINTIKGIKLQASVLENHEVVERLKSICLTNTSLMINISGYMIDDALNLIQAFSSLSPKELVVQIGFQSYPTEIEHTGLIKIQALKGLIKNKICIADHTDAQTEEAIDIPVYAVAVGADMIEKHFCLDRNATKYDFYSSLNKNEFHQMFKKLNNLYLSKGKNFLNNMESEYLRKTIQIPILKHKKNIGDLLSPKDFIYRRTSQVGLKNKEIFEIQERFSILKREISEHHSITKNDFKNAKIAVIVAGRLKSTRLKKKAILPINGKTSLEWCLNSCLAISNVEKVILATSTLEQDSQLVNYLPTDKRMCFFQGDPEDVISRYVAAADKHEIDVVIRVTADCPFISKEIAEILLAEHFKKGADYTAAREFAVGTSSEIINVSALKKVLAVMGSANYSEYMTWYFQNNKDYFNVNIVDIPTIFIRNYRLTLDYEEDIRMFTAMIDAIDKEKKTINIETIFEILDNNPEIAKINSHLTLKYQTDSTLIETLNKETKINVS
jgi:N,N'-diacetyllegionaminate synthase